MKPAEDDEAGREADKDLVELKETQEALSKSQARVFELEKILRDIYYLIKPEMT